MWEVTKKKNKLCFRKLQQAPSKRGLSGALWPGSSFFVSRLIYEVVHCCCFPCWQRARPEHAGMGKVLWCITQQAALSTWPLGFQMNIPTLCLHYCYAAWMCFAHLSREHVFYSILQIVSVAKLHSGLFIFPSTSATRSVSKNRL